MPDSTVLRHSVTEQDYSDDGGKSGAVFNILVSNALQPGLATGLPPSPPPYWSLKRDHLLKQTPFFESIWAAALYIAISKMAGMAWDVKGYPALRVRNAQSLLLDVGDGNGWVSFLSKHLRDFLLTDNGSFVEIVRASSAAGSKILGLVHLDSTRCRRTGDPDIPVVYTDKIGKEHEMRDHQIIMMSDMPDPTGTYFDVGFCAASRAYHAIYKLAGLERYVSEKVTGRVPLALYIVNNINRKQLDNAILQHETAQTDRGFAAYMGAIMMPGIDPNSPAEVAKIDLAGLPEGFDSQQERRYAILTYADCLGLDPQELDPDLLASKSMGTGSQARVIDDKASGRGIIAWRQQFVHHLNYEVLPDRVQFYFSERDFRDQKLRADVQSVQIANISQMTMNGLITAIEGRQLLVDSDIIPPEFMPTDLTSTTALSDTDKITPEELQGTNPLIQQTVDNMIMQQDIKMQQEQLGLQGQMASVEQQEQMQAAPVPGAQPQKEKAEK